MNDQHLFILSLALAALALGLWAGTVLWRMWRMQRASSRIEEVVKERDVSSMLPLKSMPADTFLGNLHQLDNDGIKANEDNHRFTLQGMPQWLETSWGKALLAEEDRELLDQAGIDVTQGSVIYVLSRVVLALLLPIFAVLMSDVHGLKALMVGFFGFGIGLMLPKWIVRSKANKRKKQVVEELPLFIDLLRLLQGVGLSIDQSLHILANEFGSVLRVLSSELALANRLYATGRTREQSLQRLMRLSDDDDMASVVNLLVQVDKHGGAVQEPLKQFAIRLREKRQANFKEKIGAITVKMTGVMVLTLLPALIVITAGPGFMAVIRSLSNMSGG